MFYIFYTIVDDYKYINMSINFILSLMFMFIYIYIISFYKLFLFFNLCLSVILDSLSCSFTSISFLTTSCSFTLMYV